ncbi:hypothetical protein ACP_1666 [Acidobacterium capsulatum ATCC 51196]|uniref:Uncharacterized protein n=1 Tax=Acidobacterium capsulatum (strain ATCC 51196 / DSM 11244 / BCRC 80197 / JCM 7670 / NBRC 15755 / NCIMB 13165 / 161) TaxID=240015 RepID=C1F7B0_ACIC5|nr:hypothetical protein ACP_1666 [Acidobacterium capsulatum ATCC 51196]
MPAWGFGWMGEIVRDLEIFIDIWRQFTTIWLWIL